MEYFKTVVELQHKYCPSGVTIKNDLQTNGILLNDEWCEFLAKHDFLVGLSIDGPEMLHNAHRKNRAGRGTFNQVMRAVELIHKHKVSFATLTCVNNLTSQNPVEVYRFLRDVVKSTRCSSFLSLNRKPSAPMHHRAIRILGIQRIRSYKVISA
ncbi:putative arylsulfatase regulatory protein [Vibrio ishigakensis]|uniref:Putative arylsulfatase regulatory protein n=1 Tax=Vibrio ishigakensis TaxID=1481914 RepID=A0A0B8QBA9_9VIBR|nr:putative arylsulfatase regulatory protein [Vibrio ishigakensis]